MALKQVKNKIVATLKTGKVTKAMEAVSAVKMRKSQERAFLGRPYVHTAMRILQRISESHEGLAHPLARGNASSATLLVIVTSDKGLAGSVNSAVLKAAEMAIAEQSETHVIAIGRKALEFAERSGVSIIAHFTNVTDDVTLDDVTSMSDIAIRHFLSGACGSVRVIHQNFLSTFEQEPVVRQVLPLLPEEIHTILDGIKPKTGVWSDRAMPLSSRIAYTVEPSHEEVLTALMPQLIRIVLYHALLENKASEHSARMVAMKNATDKSKEVAKALTLVYNKERQASITAEVSEITGGMEALAH